MKISIIQPSRNNLKYLKWSYAAIRKNQGTHEVEICVADDFSDKDGTWEWCQEMMTKDPMFKAIRNEGPMRLGHTILYDRLVNEVATADICMIYHADMYLCPNALDAIEKHIGPKTIVSLTRIEPPLHPPGPEKILSGFGVEPEEFEEEKLLEFSAKTAFYNKNKTTEGIFAPWAFMKADFQEINGHDPLYAPQSKEDSDIFNRFQLNGVKFVQVWDGFVYHMTCRGSRFNPTLTTPGKNSNEWEAQNLRSTRNFIRKWGHFVRHDNFLKPIVPHKYNIGFIVKKCNYNLLETLEPWCNVIYVEDESQGLIDTYIQNEQLNTKYNLKTRVKNFTTDFSMDNIDVLVEIDGARFGQYAFNIVQQLSDILTETNEVGDFELDCLRITITNLRTYENELIVCNTI